MSNWLGKLKETIDFCVKEGIKTDRVEKKVAEDRLKTCEGCEHFKSSTRQCKICWCFMDVKARLMYDPVTSLANKENTLTVCPKGKW